MANVNLDNILIFILLQIFAFILIIYKKSLFKFYDYHQIQRTHNDFTPRIGGLIIFLIFYVYSFSNKKFFEIDLIVFLNGLLIIIVGTKEDLFANVSANIRFSVILLTSVFVILFTEHLPVINIPFIEKIFENKFISIIFFSLCLTVIANGVNIIDGLNGHAILSIIFSLLSLIYLNYLIMETDFYLISFLIFIIVFFFLNFPFGKIFLGDAGAYWLGWFLAIYVINFFAANSEINSWYAVIIFFYPAMEVLFSFSRKIILGRSPFKPDLDHIHLKMYHLIKHRHANPLATLFLMPLSIFPPIYIYIIHNYNVSIILIIFLQMVIYLSYFKFLPKVKNNLP